MNKIKMAKRYIHGNPEIRCPSCVKIVQEETKAITLQMPYCGSCGKRIEDAGHKYCGCCGDTLDWDLGAGEDEE
jgi:predicted amidophosphoribosyltransferase